MAKILGFARRTLVRWELNQAEPTGERLEQLLKAVHRRDVKGAQRLAVAAKSSLEAHGLAPPPAPAAPQPEVPISRARDLVDLAVHAAAEVSDSSPRAVRAIVLAALRRVTASDVPLELLAKVLGESDVPKPA